jgi:hypothetical protein
MRSHGSGRRFIVNDNGARALRNPPEHREGVIMWIGGRPRPIVPELAGGVPHPLSVVIRELIDVLTLRAAAEHQMVKDSVMQNNHAWFPQRPCIHSGVELVVADVIQLNIRFLRSRGHVAMHP